MVVVSGSNLVAAVEVKSQVGSFGNNFNNRVEEALGNATDFWTAYGKGIFKPSQKPWLGYLFMLEEDDTQLRHLASRSCCGVFKTDVTEIRHLLVLEVSTAEEAKGKA